MKRLDITFVKSMTDPDAAEVVVGTIDIDVFPYEGMDDFSQAILRDIPSHIEDLLAPSFSSPHTNMGMREGKIDYVARYFDAKKAILAECGYEEVWRDCPLVDERSAYWCDFGHTIVWAHDYDALLYALAADEDIEVDDEWWDSFEKEPNYYNGEVYVPRGSSKGIFRSGDAVLVRVNTHTDGNILLFCLDPAKEVIIRGGQAVRKEMSDD